MKNSKQNSERWLNQAEYDLNEAEEQFERGKYSNACFFAEQASQKSFKAFLINKGRRFITIHSVGELAKEASSFDEGFKSLIDPAKKLDRHYLSSRYPDAVPEPAIPAESYTKDEAEESVKTAREIFNLCKFKIFV